MHSVMLIAGEHDTRVSLRKFLESEGYTVYTATTGHYAFEVLKNVSKPSVIIFDEAAPFMPFDAFLAKKKQHPEFADIPVILMSLKTGKPDITGVEGLLNKPIELPKLLILISEFCSDN